MSLFKRKTMARRSCFRTLYVVRTRNQKKLRFFFSLFCNFTLVDFFICNCIISKSVLNNFRNMQVATIANYKIFGMIFNLRKSRDDNQTTVVCLLMYNNNLYNFFQIIPMMNPDGVFLGNYRGSLIGLYRYFKNYKTSF